MPTTTMKAITCPVPPRRAMVSLRGTVKSGQKPHHVARAGPGFMPEDCQLFAEHTAEDKLVIGRKKGPDGQGEWSLKRIYEVLPLLHRIAGRLSGGEQQMLATARMLMGNSPLLLLDEPSEGLARRSSCSGSVSCWSSSEASGDDPDRQAEHVFLPWPRQPCEADQQGPDRLQRHHRGAQGQRNRASALSGALNTFSRGQRHADADTRDRGLHCRPYAQQAAGGGDREGKNVHYQCARHGTERTRYALCERGAARGHRDRGRNARGRDAVGGRPPHDDRWRMPYQFGAVPRPCTGGHLRCGAFRHGADTDADRDDRGARLSARPSDPRAGRGL